MTVVWLNGRLVAPDDASISVLDRGLLSGYGLFETLRSYDGVPWAFEDHYERLLAGAEVIDLPLPDADVLRGAMVETLRANELTEAGVRATITRGVGPVDPQSDADGSPNLFVLAWPLRDYSALHRDGATIVTFDEGARPLAHVKSTSYAMSVAGRVYARRAGADDAVFVSTDGRVLEATGSNIFAVFGSRFVTPPVDEGILPGVTRRYVMEVAGTLGFEVEECPLRLDDLGASDEVVLTSSLREVYAARSIDGRELKRSGSAERLREAYRDCVYRTISASKG